jgi:hypothetical protein
MRVYVESGHRNPEIQALRAAILAVFPATGKEAKP